MKLTSIMFCFIFLSVNLNGQWTSCDKLCCFNDLNQNYINECKTTQDYIRRNWPKFKKHINNRQKLNFVTSIIRNNDQIVFSDYKNLHLTINFKIVSYNEYVGVKYLGDISKVKDNYIDFYGLNPYDSSYLIIDSINFNGKYIINNNYQDLLNPNILMNYIAVRPLECYKSCDGKFVYIYVFGKALVENADCNNPLLFSYMAKLIFNANGSFVGRIVENSEFLNYYGYSDCPEFIGF